MGEVSGSWERPRSVGFIGADVPQRSCLDKPTICALPKTKVYSEKRVVNLIDLVSFLILK